jgi:hypothetical protein
MDSISQKMAHGFTRTHTDSRTLLRGQGGQETGGRKHRKIRGRRCLEFVLSALEDFGVRLGDLHRSASSVNSSQEMLECNMLTFLIR